MAPAPDLSMPFDEVVRLLEEPHTGVLSTVDPRGFPHSVGIYYVPMRGAQLELHMWVYGKSQKARNVERDPRASVLVEHGEPYVDLRGALVRGEARIERDRGAIFELGKQIYERYFFERTGIALDEGPVHNIERQSAKRVNIVLSANKIVSWNHSKGRDTIASR
jgi:general stress protein 26